MKKLLAIALMGLVFVGTACEEEEDVPTICSFTFDGDYFEDDDATCTTDDDLADFLAEGEDWELEVIADGEDQNIDLLIDDVLYILDGGDLVSQDGDAIVFAGNLVNEDNATDVVPISGTCICGN